MIKADNTEKRCFVACDEQTKKDGRCSCLINTNQALQLQQTDVSGSFTDMEAKWLLCYGEESRESKVKLDDEGRIDYQIDQMFDLLEKHTYWKRKV